MVRAKFKVISVKRTDQPKYERNATSGQYEKVADGELHSIEMSPVSANNDPNHENSKFWAASPSGSLVLGTVNPEAVAQFHLGHEYYVDFTEAPAKT